MSKKNINALATTTASQWGGSNSTGYTGASGYGGSSGGSYGAGWSTNLSPKKAFAAHGIEFWGSAKSNLDDLELTPQDLIINCTGMTYTIEPFVKKSPKWMNLEIEGGKVNVVLTNQIVLEWKDYKPPPEIIEITFWESILRQALEHGITRIICCCFAGKGRTGTCLASLALASGIEDEPGDAIRRIRDAYYHGAIETDGQEYYLFNLIYDLKDLAKDLQELE